MNDLLLIDWGLKAGLILAAAWAVNRGFLRRRGSASLKHLVWLAGLAAALAMPILSSVVPRVGNSGWFAGFRAGFGVGRVQRGFGGESRFLRQKWRTRGG